MSKSFRSRVGSVMKRSSTILAIARPNTPGPSDSETVSVKSQRRSSTPALAPSPAPPGLPSPVAESPAREEQAVDVDQPRSSIAAVVSAPTESPKEVSDASTTIAPATPSANVQGQVQLVAFADDPVKMEDKKPDSPPVGDVKTGAESVPQEDLSPGQSKPVVQAPTPRMMPIPIVPVIERSASNTEAFPSQGTGTFDSGDIQPVMPDPKPTYSSIDPWASAPEVEIGKPAESAGVRSNGTADLNTVPSLDAFGMPAADPFADSHAVTNNDYVDIPISAINVPYIVDETEDPNQGTMSMPLPAPYDDVTGIRAVPMAYSLTGGSARPAQDTDERRPLLSRPDSPKHVSYLQSTSAEATPALIRVPQGYNRVSNPLLHNLGWIEYVLPDASTYYLHPTLRVTTDVDLRNTKKLEAVTSFFDQQKSGAPVGLELWLRDLTPTRRGFVPKSFLVDHRKRGVMVESMAKEGRAGKSKLPEEDKLDMEYRYWCYIESHPVHTSLPANAKAEAIDALNWALADRLLPGYQRVPPPFTQEECQQLVGLLQTFGNEMPAQSNVHSTVYTRVIARILLRVVQWRQTHSRPWKPLPVDAMYTGQPAPHAPFKRRIADLFISCLCLGIPYFFMERVQLLRADEESGLQAPGPKLIIWACTCLAAAIVLSTSVTFLSLPGLDHYARIAGLLGVFLSTASLTSSVVVLFRLKSDTNRADASMSGEGFIFPPRRGFVLSLPLVFLAYSLTAFVAGISLYSFRGVSTTNPGTITRPFDDYTKWTVAGGVGGMICMLIASVWFGRR